MDEQTSLLISRTKSHTELRAELENLVIKDMLGHAGGPEEEITERSVRDRYLVGMLAPRKDNEAAEVASFADNGEETFLPYWRRASLSRRSMVAGDNPRIFSRRGSGSRPCSAAS